MKIDLHTHWKPTCELRLLHGITLQQKWKSEHGHSEWRNIQIAEDCLDSKVTDSEIQYLIENQSYILSLYNDCPILINMNSSFIDEDKMKRSSGMITISERVHAILCREDTNYVTDIPHSLIYLLVNHVPKLLIKPMDNKIIVLEADCKSNEMYSFSTLEEYNLLPTEIQDILNCFIHRINKKIERKKVSLTQDGTNL